MCDVDKYLEQYSSSNFKESSDEAITLYRIEEDISKIYKKGLISESLVDRVRQLSEQVFLKTIANKFITAPLTYEGINDSFIKNKVLSAEFEISSGASAKEKGVFMTQIIESVKALVENHVKENEKFEFTYMKPNIADARAYLDYDHNIENIKVRIKGLKIDYYKKQ